MSDQSRRGGLTPSQWDFMRDILGHKYKCSPRITNLKGRQKDMAEGLSKMGLIESTTDLPRDYSPGYVLTDVGERALRQGKL